MAKAARSHTFHNVSSPLYLGTVDPTGTRIRAGEVSDVVLLVVGIWCRDVLVIDANMTVTRRWLINL